MFFQYGLSGCLWKCNPGIFVRGEEVKRLLVLSLCVIILFISGCVVSDTHGVAVPENQTVLPSASQSQSPEVSMSEQNIEIEMWTFPVGAFDNMEVLEDFTAKFNEIYQDITVKLKTLDFKTGDAEIEEAIAARNAPDIVMEGPERLVANWGARGLMIDLKDMWDEQTTADIAATSQSVVDACRAPDGAYYQYPLVMTAHVMAINYEVFEEAGALQYIDLQNRTWTTQDFISAMEAIRDSNLVPAPGILYTGGQGGDQGTRALVTNLYGAHFTNDDHNAYLINEENGVKALTLLQDMVDNGSLVHNPEIVASDELQMFATQQTAVTLAWNATNESLYAEQVDFTPIAMNFPSDDGTAELQGGIWGFGIFNNGDMQKMQASKLFIDFLANHPEQYRDSIIATQFFPVNSSHGDVYEGTAYEERMSEYESFMNNLGDYYQVTTEWPEQRIAWYQMLQKVFSGEDVQMCADEYVRYLDEKIAA